MAPMHRSTSMACQEMKIVHLHMQHMMHMCHTDHFICQFVCHMHANWNCLHADQTNTEQKNHLINCGKLWHKLIENLLCWISKQILYDILYLTSVIQDNA